jgi:anti-anti-sigma regulatory factor
MLRLTRSTPSTSQVVLKAEGQIVAEWVGLLETECRELLATDRQVVLDLAEVSYLDRRAVRMLRELTRGSLGLINCPPLVEELLTEDVPE